MRVHTAAIIQSAWLHTIYFCLELSHDASLLRSHCFTTGYLRFLVHKSYTLKEPSHLRRFQSRGKSQSKNSEVSRCVGVLADHSINGVALSERQQRTGACMAEVALQALFECVRCVRRPTMKGTSNVIMSCCSINSKNIAKHSKLFCPSRSSEHINLS